MTFALLAKKKKNSVPATTTSDVTTVATTIPVSHAEYFHDSDGVLITSGIVLGFDNAIRSRPEEITITGISATSGPANLTGVTRGVNADGTIGVGYAWPSGTSIAVMGMTTGDWNKIKDNFAALPQSCNAIINGDCRVNQRVTAFTLVKDKYPWDDDDLTGPDRHEGMATGTAVSAGTWGQTLTATAGHSGYAFKFAGVTLTGAGVLWHRTRIEAKDACEFKNQIASFSVSVYHDVGSAINYTVYVRKANAADNFSAVTAISNSGAISVPSATKTLIKYENISLGDVSNGVEIEIKIEAGAVTTKNFEQSELQIEKGSVCTAFEYRDISKEVSLCLRYYHNRVGQFVGQTQTPTCYGVAVQTGTIACGNMNYPVPMRVAPAVTLYSYAQTPGKISLFADAGDVGGTVSVVMALASAYGCLELTDVTTPFTVGAIYWWGYRASAEL